MASEKFIQQPPKKIRKLENYIKIALSPPQPPVNNFLIFLE